MSVSYIINEKQNVKPSPSESKVWDGENGRSSTIGFVWRIYRIVVVGSVVGGGIPSIELVDLKGEGRDALEIVREVPWKGVVKGYRIGIKRYYLEKQER